MALLVAAAFAGALLAANPQPGSWLNYLGAVPLVAVVVAGLSFVLYVLTGLLHLVIGAGKAVVETTAASLPGGGLKPPREHK